MSSVRLCPSQGEVPLATLPRPLSDLVGRRECIPGLLERLDVHEEHRFFISYFQLFIESKKELGNANISLLDPCVQSIRLFHIPTTFLLYFIAALRRLNTVTGRGGSTSEGTV